jgi:multiple sugar transport system permease protein
MATADRSVQAQGTLTGRPGVRRRGSALTGTRVAPWVFVAPFFILLFAFSLGPGLYSLYNSLQSDQTGQFVGLDNYNAVVNDPDFQAAGRVIWQCVYTLAPLFCIIATVVALVLDSKAGWGKGLIKLLIFLPFAIPATASTILWAFNFSPDSSVFGAALRRMGAQDLLFFSTPTALPYAIMNIVVWQNVGAWVIVLTASLAGIPQELVEMARIEGAGALSIVRHIKLPLLMPVLVLMVVSVTSYVLTLITEPYLLQNTLSISATFTPNMWAYNISFQSGFFNLAAAAAMLLLLIASVFAILFVVLSGMYRLQERD